MTDKLTPIKALKDVVTGKAEYAEQSEIDRRMSICKNCENFLSVMKVCQKCGCFMPAKTKFMIATCPVGKW